MLASATLAGSELAPSARLIVFSLSSTTTTPFILSSVPFVRFPPMPLDQPMSPAIVWQPISPEVGNLSEEVSPVLSHVFYTSEVSVRMYRLFTHEVIGKAGHERINVMSIDRGFHLD